MHFHTRHPLKAGNVCGNYINLNSIYFGEKETFTNLTELSSVAVTILE